MKMSFLAIALCILALMMPGCATKANGDILTVTPSETPKETRAPGDFPLEAIVKGAEHHMANAEYTEIPTEELKRLYPCIAALPVELRGRRAADGSEYLVMASIDRRTITDILDVQQVLEGDAGKRAQEIGMEYRISASDYNKYGAVALAKEDADGLLGTICRAFTGEYIAN